MGWLRAWLVVTELDGCRLTFRATAASWLLSPSGSRSGCLEIDQRTVRDRSARAKGGVEKTLDFGGKIVEKMLHWRCGFVQIQPTGCVGAVGQLLLVLVNHFSCRLRQAS